jgi:hypothetical protein
VTPNLPNSYLNGACNLSPSHSTAGPFDGSKSECELGSDPDSVTPGIFGASNEPKLIRKDYAENSNNSFWLANANQLLTGFSPALGNENANPGMRSQTGIDMVNQRMGTGNGGVPTDGLGATPGFTVQKLQESWTSYRAMPAERALPGLREICENAVKNTGGVINKVNVSAACPILNAYDSTAKLNSPGGWLFNRWWASAPTTNAAFWVNPFTLSNIVYTPNTLNTTLAASQNALATAVTDLETRGIPLNASFGQVQYTQRATKIPIPGCSDGSMCFAVINSSYDNSTAKTAAVNGSSSSIVMFTELDPVSGPLTKGLLTYSQSEDVTSPFYEDQTKRFSKDEWITLPWSASQVSADAISPPQALSTEPGAPTLSAGTTPNANGLFTLSWTGPDPASYGIVYTLQHRNAAGEWTNVATGLEARSYQFTGAGEGEGTWTYRVQGSVSGLGLTTEWSPASEEVKVDQSSPNAPSANADRSPDYAGGGGWYKDTVTVSFSDNGDPLLSDGSSGSGVDLGTLSGAQTFNTDGAHEASGTVADNVGNVSSPGTLSVQVDVSPPSVEASCPAPVSIGAKGVNATVTASDGQSGLAKDPSGSYPINTSTGGVKTVKVTAIDNVGHETEGSCSTLVGYTQVITTNLKGNLTIKAGQAIKLTKTAKVSGNVVVKPGGALDVEGATISGSLSAKEATLMRICGAKAAKVTVSASSGSVVIGEGNEECPSSKFGGVVTIKENKAGVLIDENDFSASLKVINNAGGTTVTNNKIAGELVVKGNTGTVVDTPNEVEGKSKIQ